MHQVVIFNGPPGSGKDTLANYYEDCLGYQHLRFKDGLVPLVLKAYKITQEWFTARYTRDLKDVPCPELCGMSPRQSLINMSENVIKPAFGESAFGDIVARQIDMTRTTVFSDGGFIEELRPVVDKVGADNVIIIQISRPNCSFDNDSRSYYPQNILGCKTIQYENSSSINELFSQVDQLLGLNFFFY